MTLVNRRPGRRVATSLLTAGLAILFAASSAFASTPVTVGYRDHTYGGGSFRPTSDKPQSKLWYTDGSWFAGMFLYQTSPIPRSENRIWRLNQSTHTWALMSSIVDTRDESHADYYWDEGAQTLWVASVNPPNTTNPVVAAADGIAIYKFTYSNVTHVYTAAAGFPKTIQNTTSVANTFAGGAWTVTITRDSGGRLWTAWPKLDKVLYSYSDDGGATWSDPAQVPVQVGNSINSDLTLSHDDTASVIAFGTKIGVAWSDQDNLPASTDNGYYFAVIDQGADPLIGGNWTLQKLPTLTTPGQTADNHMNLKTTSDGSVYMVGKTGKDTAGCATNQNAVLMEFFDRTPAGTWTAHLVGTVGDCNTRPQLVISEELDTAYVFLTSPNGGGTVYRKSAPLSGSDAFKFRGTADTTIQRGTPFIQSSTETLIDDPSTTKQVVTSASGIVVVANNLIKAGTSNAKYFLHNEMALPASDAAAPSGTISINGGAAATTSADVSVAVPATDAGSGMSLVRLSNSSATSGGVLTTGTTYVYPGGTAILPWTLSAGDGTKSVYVQWRDAVGNWSTPISDTIDIDQTAPTGTVVINGGDLETTTTAVTLTLTTDDGSGSGTTQVLISNSTDFTGVTPIAYATTIPWTLTGGNGSKTVYVKFIDAVGNVSASPVNDDITLNSSDVTPPTAPGAPKQTLAGTKTYGIPLRLTWTPGTDSEPGNSGVAGYNLQQSVDGGAFTTIAQPTAATIDLVLTNTSHLYRYRVQTRDGAGNVSAYATGPTFKAITYSEQNAVMSYTGTWYLVSAPTYIAGKAKYATAKGATATATFKGSKVGWLGRKGPTSGTAKVYVDGVLKATVNMYSATTQIRQLLFTYSWSTVGTHKLKIVVSGTAGHPRVTLDQVLVLR
jgi:hypothetical protein